MSVDAAESLSPIFSSAVSMCLSEVVAWSSVAESWSSMPRAWAMVGSRPATTACRSPETSEQASSPLESWGSVVELSVDCMRFTAPTPSWTAASIASAAALAALPSFSSASLCANRPSRRPVSSVLSAVSSSMIAWTPARSPEPGAFCSRSIAALL